DGEQVYVALAYDHTRPQEQLPTGCALAVLRNVPQDGGCAQYHVIGAVEQNSKGWQSPLQAPKSAGSCATA
ncbi:MAG: hypothetical protein DBX44_03340, partial [Oscillospiraceae bacterium]